MHKISAPYMEELSLEAKDVQNLLLDIRSVLSNIKTFDFDNPTSLSDESYFNLTGLRKGI